MRQRCFSNGCYLPNFYSTDMENLHDDGFGFAGMSIINTYIGCSGYSTGEGFIVESSVKYNYNLIFKC